MSGRMADMWCPACAGAGALEEHGMECCGNCYPDGQCRGYCARESREPAQCHVCGGSGRIPLTDPSPQPSPSEKGT